MNISLEDSTTTAPGKGVVAVELPQTNAHSNGEITDHTNGSTHKLHFELTLSVSTQTVHTKAEGGKITAFETLTIDTTDEDKVRSILTSRNYSTNAWAGSCSRRRIGRSTCRWRIPQKRCREHHWFHCAE